MTREVMATAITFLVLENPQLDWGFSLALAVINKQKTSLFDII